MSDVTFASALPSVLAGLGLGFSLIIAIGAQNAFVLRQGIARHHVLAVVLVCAVSDAVLILLGVLGIGVIVERALIVLDIVRIVGGLFLLGYAVLAARRAWRPAALDAAGAPPRAALRTVIGTALALTWLNPHVYLDTVLLLGGVASSHGDPGRWAFAAGAVTASIVWFTALGFGARLLGPVFAKPAAWRILDALIAVTMTALGLSLLLGH